MRKIFYKPAKPSSRPYHTGGPAILCVSRQQRSVDDDHGHCTARPTAATGPSTEATSSSHLHRRMQLCSAQPSRPPQGPHRAFLHLGTELLATVVAYH